jgi:hypothetical protein
MKAVTAALVLILSSAFAQANTIPSSKIDISPSDVDQVVRLVEKQEIGSSYKKLSIIVKDSGMSTDVSPRYSVYLGYASLAEMGNITADFLINERAYEFISAKRKTAGIYEVKTLEYRDDGMYAVTQEIDATQMFLDEKKQRKECGSDFCDKILETTVSVKEQAIKQ